MLIQTENIISETSKAAKIAFYHPLNCRMCFAWFPLSQIKYLPNNEIKIPNWLWSSIKQNL